MDATVIAVVLGVLLAAALVALAVQTRRLTTARPRLPPSPPSRPALPTPSLRSSRAGQAAQAAGLAVRTVVETASRLREQGVREHPAQHSIDDFTDWALEHRIEIARVAAADGTVTIFFSDIESSTALNTQLGDEQWVKLLASHDRLLHTYVDKHRGQIVKNQGDGYMVVFSTPELAVAAAMDIQRALSAKRQRNRRLRRTPIRVRIGLHTGTAIEREGDYFGSNVAMAARVAALADGGEILVTGEIAEALAGPRRLALHRGRHRRAQGPPRRAHPVAGGARVSTSEDRPLTPEETARVLELAMHFAREGMTEELAGFVDHGLPVDARDADGNTPLMLAAYHGHAGTVAMLLERGADVDGRNGRDQSPLAGALFKGEDEVVRVLRRGRGRPRRRYADRAGGGRDVRPPGPAGLTRAGPRRRRRQRGRLAPRRLVARPAGRRHGCTAGWRSPTRRTTRSCWCSRDRPGAAYPRAGRAPAHRARREGRRRHHHRRGRRRSPAGRRSSWSPPTAGWRCGSRASARAR